MAQKKISELTEALVVADDDLLVNVDTSESETKKVQADTLKEYIVGDTSTLNTTSKEVVGAINEVDTRLTTAESDIETLDDNSVIVSATEPTGTDRKKNWFQYSKNIFNKEIYYTDKFLTTGGAYGESAGNYSSIIEIEGGNDYTISKNLTTRCRIATFEEYPYTGVTTVDNVTDDSATEKTISTSSNAKFLMFQFGASGDTIDQTLLDSIQIEKGSTATDVEPYVNPTMWILNSNDVYELFMEKDTTGNALLNLTSDQSISNNTATAISWDTVTCDTSGFYSSSSPTRLTIPSEFAGKCVIVTAGIRWDSNTTGGRFSVIRKNSSAECASETATAGQIYGRGYTNITKTFCNLNDGDYFDIQVTQNSGAALNVTADDRTFFEIKII